MKKLFCNKILNSLNLQFTLVNGLPRCYSTTSDVLAPLRFWLHLTGDHNINSQPPTTKRGIVLST